MRDLRDVFGASKEIKRKWNLQSPWTLLAGSLARVSLTAEMNKKIRAELISVTKWSAHDLHEISIYNILVRELEIPAVPRCISQLIYISAM